MLDFEQGAMMKGAGVRNEELRGWKDLFAI